jgi:hypothetical protein
MGAGHFSAPIFLPNIARWGNDPAGNHVNAQWFNPHTLINWSKLWWRLFLFETVMALARLSADAVRLILSNKVFLFRVVLGER